MIKRNIVTKLILPVARSVVSQDPTQVPPFSQNLDTWIDMSKLDTITESGGFVSQIVDPRGAPRVFIQGNMSLRPRTGLVSKNGLNVLSFVPGDLLTADSLSPTLSNQEVSVFAAIRDTQGGAVIWNYFDMFGAGNKGVTLNISDSGGPNAELAAFRDVGTSNTTVSALFGNALDWNVAGGTRSTSGNRVRARINSDERDLAIIGEIAETIDKMTIGMGRLNVANPVTEIGEIVVYSIALDQSQRDKVVQYLSDKWAIT